MFLLLFKTKFNLEIDFKLKVKLKMNKKTCTFKNLEEVQETCKTFGILMSHWQNHPSQKLSPNQRGHQQPGKFPQVRTNNEGKFPQMRNEGKFPQVGNEDIMRKYIESEIIEDQDEIVDFTKKKITKQKKKNNNKQQVNGNILIVKIVYWQKILL